MLLIADGLNFFRTQALFGLLPVHESAQESCLTSQLAVGIPKMYMMKVLCLIFFCSSAYLHYISHVVTRACETAHRHVKHIGALSPGLAPHPGEASPGGRMDQIMKVLEKLCKIITRTQELSIYDLMQYICIFDR